MAVKARLISHNVASGATNPHGDNEPAKIRPLTTGELRRLLAVSVEHRLGRLFTVVATLALRPSEAFGLRWADVDLPANRLRIAQRIYFLNGEYDIGPPKTAKSRREIIFPPEIGEVLREQRRAVLEEQMAARGWTDHDLVFPSTNGGPLYGSYVTRTMQRYLEAAGLPRRRLYDLRHTGASALLAQGVDVRVIADVLGHTDSAFTARTYVHPEERMREDAAAKMAAVLQG